MGTGQVPVVISFSKQEEPIMSKKTSPQHRFINLPVMEETTRLMLAEISARKTKHPQHDSDQTNEEDLNQWLTEVK